MKLTHRKIYNQCSIALISVLLMISSTRGIILCDAEDGHVSVEIVSSACCDNLNASISSEAFKKTVKKVISSNQDDCGPCVDTPIHVVLTKIFKKPHAVNSTPQVFNTTIPITVVGCDFTNYQLDSGLFSLVNPCLASLRTIILLA